MPTASTKLTIHQAGHQMDARGMRLSSKVNVDKSHSQRKLHWLATSYCQKFPQTLSGNRANVRFTKPKQVPFPEATDDKLKQLIGKKEQDVYISVIDTWAMKTHNILRSDGQIPNTIERRQLIHHGDGRN